MEENRKIDNLFRKKIPAGEETPPEEVWENISARLSRHEKRRGFVIPLWYRIAGIAAVLLIIFSLVQQWDRPVGDSPDLENSSVESGVKNIESDAGDKASEASEEPGKNRESVPGTAVTVNTATPEQTQESEVKNFPGAGKKDRLMLSPTEVSFNARQRIAYNVVPVAGNTDLLNLELPLTALEETLMGNEEKTEDLATEIETDKSLKNRFSISPVVAAVYFGNIGGGNALDDRLSSNTNSGEITAVYGISFGYGISERLKIRSGFNSVSLNSSTRDVDNALAINASAIDSDPAASFGIPAGIGDLNQHLRFLEIPLELEYTLVDRRFGINLITGASTFLLQENEISLNSNSFTGPLGSANNLNSTSFSANLGLGFKYRFTPKFFLNLDPVFKYQFNMYENVEDLQPYHFGIYSGIHFRF